jgi:hypothetical protein
MGIETLNQNKKDKISDRSTNVANLEVFFTELLKINETKKILLLEKDSAFKIHENSENHINNTAQCFLTHILNHLPEEVDAVQIGTFAPVERKNLDREGAKDINVWSKAEVVDYIQSEKIATESE